MFHTPVHSLPIANVPISMAWTLVTATPEGTALWQALLAWRTFLAEKRDAEWSRNNRQGGTYGWKRAQATLALKQLRLQRAYATACLRLEQAITTDDVRAEFGAELFAIAEELGVTAPQLADFAPKKPVQLALELF